MTTDKFRIDGRVIVITGGAGLLGTRHAAAVAETGGVPVVIDTNEVEGEKRVLSLNRKYGCSAMFCSADITSEEQLRQVLKTIKKKYGQPPHGLINNAAIDPKFDKHAKESPKTRIEAFPLAQWEKELRVGLTGAFLCSRIFGSEMAKRRRGVIVNISSDLGVIAPDQRLYRRPGVRASLQDVKPVTYSVIKHGIIGLTKYLATYWAERGVRCNALAPGGVFNAHDPAFVKRLSSLIPLGRMAHKDEYKSAIQFLVSDASSYMTGATMVMDGGRSIW